MAEHRDKKPYVENGIPESHAEEAKVITVDLACVYKTSDAKIGVPSLGGADLSPAIVPTKLEKLPLAGPLEHEKTPNEIN